MVIYNCVRENPERLESLVRHTAYVRSQPRH